MPTNCKQFFITQSQPHCHPSTKSLGLCSSVLSAADPISRYMVVARTKSEKMSFFHEITLKSIPVVEQKTKTTTRTIKHENSSKNEKFGSWYVSYILNSCHNAKFVVTVAPQVIIGQTAVPPVTVDNSRLPLPCTQDILGRTDKSILSLRGQRPISGRTYFRHICSLGVNFMQLWFFALNRFLI